MRLGLNSFLYVSPFTTDSVKLFPKFKKWGFETVEIPVEDPSHIDPVKVKAAADKAGLKIGSICACMGPGRDLRGSAKDQKTGSDYIRTLIDQAVILGCPSVIGPIYSVVGLIGPHDDKEKKQQFDLVVKNLKPLAKYAESKGVQLCIEPLNRFETDFLNTCDQGLKLIKAVNNPAVKLHLDTFHLGLGRRDPPLLDELLDERVIGRDPRDLAVAQQVGATVADVDDRQVAITDVDRRERRAHPGVVVRRQRHRVDLRVRVADHRHEPLGDAAGPVGNTTGEDLDRRP